VTSAPTEAPAPVATPTPTKGGKKGATPTPAKVTTPTTKPTAQAKDKKAALKTTKGEKLYIKSGDKYVAATAADYIKDPKQKFYKQSKEATGYTYTGWQVIEGSTFFFDKNGNKVTGEQVIQGAKYTFNSDGVLQAGSGSLGIDVSKWNGAIDWTKVRNSGISYVIIRCGYRGSTTGALIEDPNFRSNIKGATAAGLKVGVYFFTQATNEVEAVEEASMTLNLISGYKINYPVFLDVEGSGGRGDAIDSGTRTAVINAYCKTIANSGYSSGVYANKTWLSEKFNPGSLGGAKIWLAQYNTAPTYGGRYNMWQYTSKGKVSGISGNVDMNLSYMGY
jgi:GH25 family lysozyme M1 (1,4-beta-N-acetylmuramidase)